MLRYLSLSVCLVLLMGEAGTVLATPAPGEAFGAAGEAILCLLGQSLGEDEEWMEESAPRGGIITRREEEPLETPGRASKLKAVSFSLSLSAKFPVGGYAGAGENAPGYAESFGLGLGPELSGGYRILPCLEGRVGLGFSRFPAKDFDLAGTSNRLSDFYVGWFVLHPRFVFLIDRKVESWFSMKSTGKPYVGFFPYAGLDFSIFTTVTGRVKWTEPAPESRYWGQGVTFLFGVAGGAEYRFTESFGLFAELGLTIFGPPNAADHSNVDPAMTEAGSLTALGVSLGAVYAF